MPIYYLSRVLMWSTVQRISMFKRVYFINNTISRVKYRSQTPTVRLIETVRLSIFRTILRSYYTFNRVILKILQTVRLIETWLIIESSEYIKRKRNIWNNESRCTFNPSVRQFVCSIDSFYFLWHFSYFKNDRGWNRKDWN